MIQDSAKVTVEHVYDVIYSLSNGAIFSDLECLAHLGFIVIVLFKGEYLKKQSILQTVLLEGTTSRRSGCRTIPVSRSCMTSAPDFKVWYFSKSGSYVICQMVSFPVTFIDPEPRFQVYGIFKGKCLTVYFILYSINLV